MEKRTHKLGLWRLCIGALICVAIGGSGFLLHVGFHAAFGNVLAATVAFAIILASAWLGFRFSRIRVVVLIVSVVTLVDAFLLHLVLHASYSTAASPYVTVVLFACVLVFAGGLCAWAILDPSSCSPGSSNSTRRRR